MTNKTWGPFTGNHLTAIAGFIILAIAVPGGLWAADPFSNAAIYDPISGNTAAVASNKQLLIGDGSGALTVDGSLIATQTRPADFYHYGHGLLSAFAIR